MLEQQQYLLGKTTLSPAEQQARIDLQKRIQAAVLGKGKWDDVPEPLQDAGRHAVVPELPRLFAGAR